MTTAATKASVPHKEKMESKEPETSHQPEAYPDLASYQELAVHVSIADQVMTIIGDGKVIFKTSVSTGAKESPTPTGTFVMSLSEETFSSIRHQKRELIIGCPLRTMGFICFTAYQQTNMAMRFQRRQRDWDSQPHMAVSA